MSLHYRAAISQNTGEDWADVANLTLSTAAPHYMTSIPSLGTFKIKPTIPSMLPPPPQQQMPAGAPFPEEGFGSAMPSNGLQSSHIQAIQYQQRARLMAQQAAQQQVQYQQQQQQQPQQQRMSAGHSLVPVQGSLPPLSSTTTAVSDSGISATFKVMGRATIPSDTLSHNVAIAALQVESEISYITVPKVSPVAYLQVSASFLFNRIQL